MTDPIKELEAELSSMQPSPFPATLAARVETELLTSESRLSPWPDRFLLSAICSGALAACMIIVVLVGGAMGSNPSAGPTEQVNAKERSSGSVAASLAFAPNDPVWMELLK
jgi:hypothetical protein